MTSTRDLPWDPPPAGRLLLPDGRYLTIPFFWAGGRCWKARIAAPRPGEYQFHLSDAEGLPETDFGFTVHPAEPSASVAFLRHGPVGISQDGRFFAHSDGTPFFLLADSWWHGISARITDHEFARMARHRREQGFNAVQCCVGFACDMPPFDPRDANDAGHPWEPEYSRINPAFYDAAERRILHLIENGMLPILVGMWGYHQHFMGNDRVRAHWRHFMARFGALPVLLVLCGESTLPWYPLIGQGDHGVRQTQVWTEVFQEVRTRNPFNRPITIHPGPQLWFNEATYPPLTDLSLPDFHVAMGGHGPVEELPLLLKMLQRMDELRQEHRKPVVVGEALWEYMNAGCGPKTQRAQFWHAVLRGAPGHCYGADALWQMNSRQRSFGPSPSGFTWGNEPWEDALHWPGAEQVATGKKILEDHPWWDFEPHPEWIQPNDLDDRIPIASATGIGDRLRLFYLYPAPMVLRKQIMLHCMPPGVPYQATYLNPISGATHSVTEPLLADPDGRCPPPVPPSNQDWVLALRPCSSQGDGAA